MYIHAPMTAHHDTAVTVRPYGITNVQSVEFKFERPFSAGERQSFSSSLGGKRAQQPI